MPKVNRRRLENAGEGEACKRCNCKKSKCLKLYCECFAAGVYCVEPCSCHDCFNKPVHEDTVLATRKQIESRNPLAFAPKVIRNSETIPETGDEGIKASNILLDGEMKPKISDFGTTRLFELGQTQGNTNCIAGT